MKMKKTLLILLIIAPSFITLSQVPGNNNPCTATALTVNASCTYTTYTNANATASTGSPAPGCAS